MLQHGSSECGLRQHRSQRAPDGAGADGSLDHIIYGHYALTIT